MLVGVGVPMAPAEKLDWAARISAVAVEEFAEADQKYRLRLVRADSQLGSYGRKPRHEASLHWQGIRCVGISAPEDVPREPSEPEP